MRELSCLDKMVGAIAFPFGPIIYVTTYIPGVTKNFYGEPISPKLHRAEIMGTMQVIYGRLTGTRNCTAAGLRKLRKINRVRGLKK